jgi:hypothetical protein
VKDFLTSLLPLGQDYSGPPNYRSPFLSVGRRGNTEEDKKGLRQADYHYTIALGLKPVSLVGLLKDFSDAELDGMEGSRAKPSEGASPSTPAGRTEGRGELASREPPSGDSSRSGVLLKAVQQWSMTHCNDFETMDAYMVAGMSAAHNCNQGFGTPFDDRRVVNISKSALERTWRNRERFRLDNDLRWKAKNSEVQSLRAKKASETKKEIYGASERDTKPWVSMGISRKTYYKRKRQGTLPPSTYIIGSGHPPSPQYKADPYKPKPLMDALGISKYLNNANNCGIGTIE